MTDVDPTNKAPTLDDLEENLAARGIHVVEAWTPDIHGVVRGKRFPADVFASVVAQHGFHMADSILCWTRDCGLFDDISFSNMETGYPDLTAVPELATLHSLPWRPGHGAVLCRMESLAGEAIDVDPRTVLIRQIDHIASLGFEVRAALEYEFYLLSTDGIPINGGNDCYAFVLPEEIEAFLARTLELRRLGLPIEAAETEWGTAQIEVTLRSAPALAAADQAAMFKTAIKAIARQVGLVATFMPKPFADQPGSGMHVNQSLWDRSGRNIFDASVDDNDLATARSKYLGGVLATASDFFLLGAPTVNAYKRRAPGSFAPTTVTWSTRSRTAGVRAMFDRGQGESRIEYRMPGADANPYLGLAASLAGGLHGIQIGASFPPELKGSSYDLDVSALELPATLSEAIGRFRGSAVSRSSFGGRFVDHYSTIVRHDEREFSSTVTDWELRKYLHYA